MQEQLDYITEPKATLLHKPTLTARAYVRAFRSSSRSRPRFRSASLQWLSDLLESTQIMLNGNQPWDIQVHDPAMADRVAANGALGLGESYMDGSWDVEQLDEFFARLLKGGLEQHVRPASLAWHNLRARLLNLQNTRRAWQVGKVHYDLGNDFYAAMLDPHMVYSCGYWNKAKTLNDAQLAKLDLVCRKLELQPGMRLLDIGCGWGSLMNYAARHYGVSCVGLTVSREQTCFARKQCSGLPVEVHLQDYRSLKKIGQFDRVASIGMFEHVGRKSYRHFMETAAQSLKNEGLFLLHTIGKDVTPAVANPWINKYIFPNGQIPAFRDITRSAEKLFVIEDMHNFGPDYDLTLRAWHGNFETHWPGFEARFGERFYRMWRYYLLSCAGAFRSRSLQLWQVVLSKGRRQGGYLRHI
jgi:cyclopropane-fatty-acyl-phospholipid synthase